MMSKRRRQCRQRTLFRPEQRSARVSALVALECLGVSGYTGRLRATAMAPLMIVFGSLVVAVGREAAAARRAGAEAPTVVRGSVTAGAGGRKGGGVRKLRGLLRRAALRALPPSLFITFLVLPDVSLLAFQAFRCECFGDGADAESFLRADYALKCTLEVSDARACRRVRRWPTPL